MPRKLRPICNTLPYHITARCINQDWFKIPLPIVWQIFEDYLYLLSHGFHFKIHAFVLMNNHFHMIVQTPEENLSEGMHYLMMSVGREITKLSGRINQTFGARFHSSYLSRDQYLLLAYKYVYRNPVEAGLCLRVEDYPYSTLYGLLGQRTLFIPVHDSFLFPQTEQILLWLNADYKSNDQADIDKALKKASFALPKDRQGARFAHHLETERP